LWCAADEGGLFYGERETCALCFSLDVQPATTIMTCDQAGFIGTRIVADNNGFLTTDFQRLLNIPGRRSPAFVKNRTSLDASDLLSLLSKY